jgi:hypothetical protein
MAKIKYDQNGDPYLSGTVGKSLTFMLWRGVRVMKNKPVRHGPKHAAQIRLGQEIRAAAKAWQKLSARNRRRFELAALKNGRQGAYQEFVKAWWQKSQSQGNGG